MALRFLAIALFLGLALGEISAAAEEAAGSKYDKVWASLQLYTGDDESFFQSFQLSGRLQLDLAYVDSGDVTHDEFNVRRFRLGFKTVFLEDFMFHIEGEFNPQEADPAYVRLTDTYLAWSPRDAVQLKLGKHSAGFTLDGMTSSNSLLTIDRNALTNNIWFTEEYMPGGSVSGETDDLVYFVGIFSSGGKDPEFGDFKGGEFLLLTLGHDFASALDSEQALLRFNFVYNEPDPDNDFTRPLEWITSANFAYEGRKWGVRTDLSAARGYGEQSDLLGFMVMPFRDFSAALQLVGRYTYVESDEPNGVRFGRYEREIVDGMGDRYEEIYLGLNYFWYGHKLKLQNAIQYVDMRDEADDGGAYSGWAWTTAFRLSW